MSLQDWLANKWLVAHRPSRSEIRSLLGVADRDLADAAADGLSADWRHNIAYNAVLQLAQAALAAAGYRPVREQHHVRLIGSLELTIGLDPRSLRRLDTARKRRNRAEYEAAGLISDAEAGEVYAMARELRGRAEAWLRANYPDLVH